jgi:hypothetical protein
MDGKVYELIGSGENRRCISVRKQRNEKLYE